jgi:hypothetical protein
VQLQPRDGSQTTVAMQGNAHLVQPIEFSPSTEPRQRKPPSTEPPSSEPPPNEPPSSEPPPTELHRASPIERAQYHPTTVVAGFSKSMLSESG